MIQQNASLLPEVVLQSKTYHYEISPNLSATLHLYNFRLWSNYPYGTENAFFGRCFRPKKAKESTIMSNNNNNQINVPQAREAMDRFKMQAASEVGVNLTNGYNGHLTSREAGSVGGQMVKKMIEAYEQSLQ